MKPSIITNSIDSDDLISELDIKTKLFTAIFEGIQIFKAKNELEIQSYGIERIINDFGHKLDSAEKWLNQTTYNTIDMSVDFKNFENTIEVLKDVNLVENNFQIETLWNNNNVISFK